MKFLPLVWAALMRKPARAILTLLSVTAAFTLVGLMIGMSASFDRIAAMTRADRIYVNPRFFAANSMPLAMQSQIAGLPGVAKVVPVGDLWGWYQQEKNNVYIAMGDLRAARTEWPVSMAQWDTLKSTPNGVIMSRLQAERWNKRVGDTFTFKAPTFDKLDGTKFWSFRVLAITDDILLNPDGYLFGNLLYFDKSRPLSQQGKIGYYEVMAADPERGTELARSIDGIYASSGMPTRSMTDKAAFDSGMDNGINVGAVTRKISLAGLVMILFLTANGIAQSVRERFGEFAALKTIGYGDRSVMLLVFLEASLPCLAGAALGIGLAAALGGQIPKLCPPGWGLPVPVMAPIVYLFAAGGATLIALVSTALPALQLKRMDIATALSGRK
jgi:putative ABC transport system permease protein